MSKQYKGSNLKMYTSSGISMTAVQALGTRIITEEFGELIDFESGCWAAALGHNREEIVKVICENAKLLSHTHQFFDTEHPGALVEEITSAAKLNCIYKGTFMSSGSEAVSLAVKLAEVITGKQKKLSLAISYLGASSELRLPRNPEQWLDIDITECLHCTKNSMCKECGRFNNIDFFPIAAFVLEAGNSGGLALCPPEKLITFLTEETRKEGGLIISNEVTTGFGRTGKWFGFQHYSIFQSEASSPDFIAMGKGLGNGYPISGLLVRLKLAEIIETSGFRYVQSHTDDPLGCIVSRKVVEIISKENLVEHGNEMGKYLRDKLTEIGEHTGSIDEVRGRGLMNVVILSKKYSAKEVFKELLIKGFFVGYSEVYNFIRLYAPLSIAREEIEKLVHSLESVLNI